MNVLKLFKKSAAKGSTELDNALDAIIQLERKKNEAEHSLETARQALQQAVGAELAGDAGKDSSQETAAIIAAQERLGAVSALLKQAQNEAISLLAAEAGQARERLNECEEEISAVRHAIDLRRAQAFADFATAHGLNISWPSRNTGGSLNLPALALDREEIEQIIGHGARHEDPQDGQLVKLAAERKRLVLLTRSQPDIALQTLAAERRSAA